MKEHCSHINDCFITHHNTAYWGNSILIMERSGKAFSRVYWYHNDPATVVLDWLSVDEEIRRQGIGTELQKMREEVGRKLGATMACLWVKENSWMHDWYKRRGYEDWKEYEHEKGYVWMKKELKN